MKASSKPPRTLLLLSAANQGAAQWLPKLQEIDLRRIKSDEPPPVVDGDDGGPTEEKAKAMTVT